MGLGTRFDIHFNNLMNPTVVPTVQAVLQGGKNGNYLSALPPGTWGSDNQTYSISDNATNLLPNSAAGLAVTVQVSGAYDAKGFEMDGNPGTIAYQLTPGALDSKEGWVGYEQLTPDTNNYFYVATPTPTFTPTITFTPADTLTPQGTVEIPTPVLNCHLSDALEQGVTLFGSQAADSRGHIVSRCSNGLLLNGLTNFAYFTAATDNNGNVTCPTVRFYSYTNGTADTSLLMSKDGNVLQQTTAGYSYNSQNQLIRSGDCATLLPRIAPLIHYELMNQNQVSLKTEFKAFLTNI
jgi:hypothetical protein